MFTLPKQLESRYLALLEVLCVLFALHIAILSVLQTILFEISFLRIGLILEGFGELIVFLIVSGFSEMKESLHKIKKTRVMVVLFGLSTLAFVVAFVVSIVTVGAETEAYECNSNSTPSF